jgi:hypothetical protein
MIPSPACWWYTPPRWYTVLGAPKFERKLILNLKEGAEKVCHARP